MMLSNYLKLFLSLKRRKKKQLMSYCPRFEVTALNNVLQMSYPSYCPPRLEKSLFFLSKFCEMSELFQIGVRMHGKVPNLGFCTVVMFDVGADKRKAGYICYVMFAQYITVSGPVGLA